MTCKFNGFDVVISRAFAANAAQRADGLVALFSWNLVDPKTGITYMVNNNFSLRGEQDNWKVYSRFQTIYDRDAPDEVPEAEAVKPLFFTSFFPDSKNDPKIADMRRMFFNDLAQEVLNKIQFFKEQKKTRLNTRELSNTVR